MQPGPLPGPFFVMCCGGARIPLAHTHLASLDLGRLASRVLAQVAHLLVYVARLAAGPPVQCSADREQGDGEHTAVWRHRLHAARVGPGSRLQRRHVPGAHPPSASFLALRFPVAIDLSISQKRVSVKQLKARLLALSSLLLMCGSYRDFLFADGMLSGTHLHGTVQTPFPLTIASASQPACCRCLTMLFFFPNICSSAGSYPAVAGAANAWAWRP